MNGDKVGRYAVRYVGPGSGWFVFVETTRRVVDRGAPVWLEAAGPFAFRADAIAEADRRRKADSAAAGAHSVKVAS